MARLVDVYADDIVLLAGTVAELRAMNQVVSDFAFRNRDCLNGSKSDGHGLQCRQESEPECGRRTMGIIWRASQS